VLVHAQLPGIEPKGEPDQLRQVQDRQAELSADDLLRQRLLQVPYGEGSARGATAGGRQPREACSRRSR